MDVDKNRTRDFRVMSSILADSAMVLKYMLAYFCVSYHLYRYFIVYLTIFKITSIIYKWPIFISKIILKIFITLFDNRWSFRVLILHTKSFLVNQHFRLRKSRKFTIFWCFNGSKTYIFNYSINVFNIKHFKL